MATARTQGKRTQHGKPLGVVGDDQPDSGDGQAGRPGVAERPVVPLKPGNAGGGKGPQFKTDAVRGEGRRRLGNLTTPKSVQKLQMALHAKRRPKPATASTRCTTRSAATTSWPMPGPSAAPTRAHRARTARTLRMSRRTASSGGSANWRLRSGTRSTDRIRSEECSYRRPTRRQRAPSSGRWAFRR